MIEYHNKITALYSRLSVGDEDRDGGESNSIVNQKAFLERYARDKSHFEAVWGFCQKKTVFVFLASPLCRNPGIC